MRKSTERSSSWARSRGPRKTGFCEGGGGGRTPRGAGGRGRGRATLNAGAFRRDSASRAPIAAAPGCRRAAATSSAQRSGLQEGVGVQQEDVLSSAPLEGEVIGLGEADVLVELDEVDLREALADQLAASVGRRVVDHDRLEGQSRLGLARSVRQRSSRLAGVEADDDDRDLRSSGIRRSNSECSLDLRGARFPGLAGHGAAASPCLGRVVVAHRALRPARPAPRPWWRGPHAVLVQRECPPGSRSPEVPPRDTRMSSSGSRLRVKSVTRFGISPTSKPAR